MNTRKLTTLLTLSALVGCGGGGGGTSPPPPPPPPPPPGTVTIDYEIADFTGVSINGSFVVTMLRSDEFRVEVTIDEDEASKLDVRLDGDRLNIGFLPGSDVRAETLEAVIEMPALQLVDLFGSNHVEAFEFSGSTVEISSNGSNVFECLNTAFDLVMANAFGSSLFQLVNVAPTPTAHIELSGDSSATINLMDFATVTGSLTGTSSLSYYGSNINFEMSVANTASITRLGDTL